MINYILMGTVVITALAASRRTEHLQSALRMKRQRIPRMHVSGNFPLVLQSQSQGRIVNRKTNYGTNHNSASSFNSQSYMNNLENTPISQDSAQSYNGETKSTQLLHKIQQQEIQINQSNLNDYHHGNVQAFGAGDNLMTSNRNEYGSEIEASPHNESKFIYQHINIVNSSLDFNGGALNENLRTIIQETFANAALESSVEKEDLEENNSRNPVFQQQSSAPHRKHYKIIFIAAPSHQTDNLNRVPAILPPQIEEKTLIYVLVKKRDESPLDKIQEMHHHAYKPSTPEVYFINSSHISPAPTEAVEKEAALASDLMDENSKEKNKAPSYSGSANEILTTTPNYELFGVPLQ